MEATTCRHIKTNGRRCKSPSLGLSAFCYFHSRLHRRHKKLLENSSAVADVKPNAPPSTPSTTHYLPDYATQHPIEIDLPPLEDLESIQVSISLLIAALARNRITSKRAAVLLYGLQLASSNARSITIEPNALSIARAVTRTKSGLDLAVQQIGPATKEARSNAPEPPFQTAETPDKATYNENL